jgi:hypothetical protein
MVLDPSSSTASCIRGTHGGGGILILDVVSQVTWHSRPFATVMVTLMMTVPESPACQVIEFPF